MMLFLFTFFLVYGGMHLYLFARIRSAFLLSAGPTISLAILCLLMLFAPLFLHAAERHGLVHTARVTAFVGYIWLGLLFIFLAVSLTLDLYRLIVHAGSLVMPAGVSLPKPSPMFLFICPLLLSVCINAYGYFEAKNIRTERITIESEKIPENVGRIRVVQISDVHVGIIVRGERLKGMVEEVIKTSPDILVSTGDLVDGEMNNMTEAMSLLRNIPTLYGKFAITGNHEFYAGIHESVEFTKKSGFTVLRGEGISIPDLINIAGIDDPAGRRLGLTQEADEGRLLSQLSKKNFTLLLKHLPFVDDSATGSFDLQLSGHTHKGQIFPFSLITKLYFPHHTGFFNLPRQSRLYVSRGTGTWGPPVRFMSPPEITVIDLVHKKPSS